MVLALSKRKQRDQSRKKRGQGKFSGNRDMSYDGRDHLTDVASPMYGSIRAHYDYDVLERLTHAAVPDRDHAYCYDASNRLS